MRRQKLGKAMPCTLGEALAAFSPPSVLGQFVHELAEVASVADGYLEWVVHQVR